MSKQDLLPGSLVGEATACALKSGRRHWLGSTVRWPCWLGSTFMSTLGGLPDWVRLLAVLHSQVGPLVRLCNHLWLVKVAGCVPCQGGTTGWTLRFDRDMRWALKSLLLRWGLRMYSLTGWCCWLDFVFRWGHRQGFMIECILRLCSVIQWGCRLCPKVGWSCRLDFTIS